VQPSRQANQTRGNDKKEGRKLTHYPRPTAVDCVGRNFYLSDYRE